MTDLEKVNGLLEMLLSTESIMINNRELEDRNLIISTFEGEDRKRIKDELMNIFNLQDKSEKKSKPSTNE